MDGGDWDRIKGAVDEIEGRAKQALGGLTGDRRQQLEGMIDEAKGKIEQALSDLRDELAGADGQGSTP